jgi:hypothetical protein
METFWSQEMKQLGGATEHVGGFKMKGHGCETMDRAKWIGHVERREETTGQARREFASS